MRNYGYQNEFDFIKLFHDKYLYELDSNSQLFLKEVFENQIDNDEKIRCWKNNMTQKADIFIKYKNYIKSISLKCGNGNSIHCEQIQEFERYLKKLNIPYSMIEKYKSYHYGYGRDSNGRFDHSIVLDSYQYKELYQNEIDLFNQSINKTRIIVDMVDRFLIRGRNSDYDIDALISGTVDDYTWILKYDLYDLILSKKSTYYTSPHICCMTIGPRKRNIKSEIKDSKDRFLVCVRWNFLKEDIINFRKEKQL